MNNHISDLLYVGPGSLQTPWAKAGFYVIHCLPEWLSIALLAVPNTRKLYRAGAWGDWRSEDGQKGCTEARKEQKAKYEEKRRAEAYGFSSNQIP